MTCPNCHTENPPGSRFCMECGTRLAVGERSPVEGPAAAPPPAGASPAEPFVAPLPATGTPPRSDVGPAASTVPSGVGETPGRARSPAELPATDPEWRMSSAGPLPEQPRRRWVLWLAVALGACLLICVALFVWSSTIGRGTLDAVATQVSAEATRQAQGQ